MHRRRGRSPLREDRPAEARQRADLEDLLAPVRAPPRRDPDRPGRQQRRARGRGSVRHRAARDAAGRAAPPVRLRDLVEARHLRGRRPRVRPAHEHQAGRERARRPQPHRGAGADGAAPLERGARQRPRRDRRRGSRFPAELRVRTARVGHPPRAAPDRRRGALPHRRHPARHRGVPAGGARGDRLAREGHGPDGHRRAPPPAGRPDQDQARLERDRAARREHSHRVRREGGRAGARSEHPERRPLGPRLRGAASASCTRSGSPRRRGCCSSPGRPARARPRRSTQLCVTWPAPR